MYLAEQNRNIWHHDSFDIFMDKIYFVLKEL